MLMQHIGVGYFGYYRATAYAMKHSLMPEIAKLRMKARIQIITATPMVHRREEANCRFWYASSRQRNKAEHHEIPSVDR
ncbi:hypothetical protein N6741_27320, partial [Klebsiella pneumoniae]|nr:hypothetical protein [Klebsiella pneumoniae]